MLRSSGVRFAFGLSFGLSIAACSSQPEAAHPAQSDDRPMHDAESLVRALPSRLSAISSSDELRAFGERASGLAGVAAVDRSEDGGIQIALRPELPARRIAHWLGMGRVFVVADAGGFHLIELERRAPGPRGFHHAYGGVPSFGKFRVDVRVTAPEGPVPDAMSNGALAYPLRDYPVKATRLMISPIRN